MSRIINTVSEWFCKEFHTKITRPVNGKYHCLTCGKTYRAPWN